MITLLLAISLPYTSPEFCSELQQELNAAAERQTISQYEADVISERCKQTYLRGH